jgi:hypothetical protein
VVRIGRFKKFLKMVLRLSCLVLEVMLSGCDMLLTVTAMHRGCNFYPFLPPLVPFLAPLMVTLGGGARLPPATAFTLPRTKAALTTSSPEVCRVAMSSSFLVAFG